MSKTLKVLIVGIVGLLAVGCATTPTKENIVGTYKSSGIDATTRKLAVGPTLVIQENGTAVTSYLGRKDVYKWSIVGREIQITDMLSGNLRLEEGEVKIHCYNLNPDGSLTHTSTSANTPNAKRKYHRIKPHYKKIK